MKSVRANPEEGNHIRFFGVFLLVLVFLVVLAVLISPLSLQGETLPVNAGQVAKSDLLAPKYVEYESEVLTEQARVDAERAVQPVYSPADPQIAREQINEMRKALQYIDEIRSNSEMLGVNKRIAIENFEGLSLTPEVIDQILSLNEVRWAAIEQEALRVLELVMRGSVREDQIEGTRSNLARLVSLSLTEDQAQYVASIASPYIVPNSFYSPELTDAARAAAREGVEPVVRSYLAGQVVVLRGRILTEADIEALKVMGLIKDKPIWQDYAGMIGTVALQALFVWLYFLRKRPAIMHQRYSLLLVSIVFIIFLAGARIIIPDRTILPYLYPIPAFGMFVSTLFGMELAMVLSLPMAILAAYGMPHSLDLTVYYIFTSLISILALGEVRRVWAFVRGSLAVAAAGTLVLLGFRIPFESWDWVGIATLAAAAFFNGAASSSLALLLQYILAQQLGLVTSLQLLEISRPDHPLLQYFLRNAPGTYQHSLQVSNLAEQAAEAIGADSLLVRIGALFHDCGKAANAQFFVENQMPGNIDSHDNMPPHDAARVIIMHVLDGVAIARKYKLPERIQDFIREHHGTLSTRYQYNRAVEAAGGDASKVNLEDFRYPGPRPQSRETALLMLADGVEARTRSERPAGEEALRQLVHRVIDYCQQDGQLDDTSLTLRDLSLITESFVSTLRGAYHPRVQYPELKTNSENVDTQPAAPPENK